IAGARADQPNLARGDHATIATKSAALPPVRAARIAPSRPVELVGRCVRVYALSYKVRLPAPTFASELPARDTMPPSAPRSDRWFVTNGVVAVGPISFDLLMRGAAHDRIPRGS